MAYLYRAVDSTGQTIDFMLSARRDTKAAKRFFRKMLKAPKHQSPRVINVDRNNAYPPAVEELKEEGALAVTSQLRQCKYLVRHEVVPITVKSGTGRDFTRCSTSGFLPAHAPSVMMGCEAAGTM